MEDEAHNVCVQLFKEHLQFHTSLHLWCRSKPWMTKQVMKANLLKERMVVPCKQTKQQWGQKSELIKWWEELRSITCHSEMQWPMHTTRCFGNFVYSCRSPYHSPALAHWTAGYTFAHQQKYLVLRYWFWAAIASPDCGGVGLYLLESSSHEGLLCLACHHCIVMMWHDLHQRWKEKIP